MEAVGVRGWGGADGDMGTFLIRATNSHHDQSAETIDTEQRWHENEHENEHAYAGVKESARTL